MSTRTRQILFQHGHIRPASYITVGTTIFPGAVVSVNAALTKAVKIAAAGTVSTGIAGLLPNHDIDTAYAAGVTIPVYTTNSGAIVWCMFVETDENGTDVVSGQPLEHDGATTPGFVIPGEGGQDEYVGVAYRDLDVSAADDTPGLLHLIQS